MVSTHSDMNQQRLLTKQVKVKARKATVLNYTAQVKTVKTVPLSQRNVAHGRARRRQTLRPATTRAGVTEAKWRLTSKATRIPSLQNQNQKRTQKPRASKQYKKMLK